MTAPPQEHAPRVSVVVPVYNPGREIEACLASLQRQSLKPAEYEIILVDDGSTDGTSERLDAVAAAEPNVRVIHLDPSGAPGRPRNTGLDAARGRYVYFVDSDDAIAPTALERLSAEADRNRADVVLAKHASASLPRGQAMFARNRSRLTLASTPALLDSSLAPNKLFRAAFLRDAEIRFPEGWRLMEDQYVVLKAYARARRISILADQTYYYFRRREDGEHLSSGAFDPEADVERLGTILDMVEAEIQGGPLRMRAIRRLYRAEILARLADEAYAELDPAYRHELFTAANRLARDRIAPEVDEGLNAMARLRSRLLREGREDELLELARRTAAVELVAEVQRAWWHHGQLRIAFEAHLADRASGEAIAVFERGGRTVMDPRLTAGLFEEPIRIDDELAAVRGNVHVREADSAAEWVIATQLNLAFRDERQGGGARRRVPLVRGESYVDPRSVGPAGSSIEAGRWAVRLRLNLMGIDQRALLRAAPGSRRVNLIPAILGDPPIVVEPAAGGDLWLAISRPAEGDGRAAAGSSSASTRSTRARNGGPRSTFVLPIASDVGLRPLQAELIVSTAAGEERLPGEARHRLGHVVVRAASAPAARGPVEIRATVDGLAAEIRLGAANVDAGGVRLESADDRRGPAAREAASWLVSRSADELRQTYERGYRRVQPLLSRALELTPRRLRAPILNATRFLRR